MFYFKRCVAVAMLVCCYTSQAQPVAAFAPGRHKVCSGSTVTLTNQSTGSHAYKWFINEVFYSSSVNDSVVLYEPCYDLQSIKLVATDTLTGLSDSATVIVEVFDTCYLHLKIEKTNCIGDTVLHKAHREAIATSWSINPAVNLLSGCDTCDSVQFVLSVIPTKVELHSIYEGNCSQKTTCHYAWCNPFVNDIPVVNRINNIMIYPNPATMELHVNLSGDFAGKSEVQVMLLNIYGQTVSALYSGKAEGLNSHKPLQLPGVPGGMYIVQVMVDGRRILNEKLTIQQ